MKNNNNILEVSAKSINTDRVVNILGVEYQIKFRDYDDFPDFKIRNAVGLCDMMSKVINICNIDSYPDYTELSQEHLEYTYKEIMRHEIMHAVLYESGLNDESHNTYGEGWATDEEIIDWFAIQAPKIFKIYNELNIL